LEVHGISIVASRGLSKQRPYQEKAMK
jgi:hypothetical protein